MGPVGEVRELPLRAENSVPVSDGLLNVMLGSINNNLASAIAGHDKLYLGVTVGTDSELSPRVWLGSVPYSMQALTVPDGSISSDKLAANALPVFSATTTEQSWLVPECSGTFDSDTDWHLIPGLSLNVTVDKPSTLSVDFTGLGYNSEPTKAIYGTIFVDGSRITTVGGHTLLGGCRNGGDVPITPWCTLANTTTQTLSPGSHTIDARVWCNGSESVGATVWNGTMKVIIFP